MTLDESSLHLQVLSEVRRILISWYTVTRWHLRERPPRKDLNFPIFFLLLFLIESLVFTLFTPFYNSFCLRLTTSKCCTISSYVKTKTIPTKNKYKISQFMMHKENCNDVQYVNCIRPKKTHVTFWITVHIFKLLIKGCALCNYVKWCDSYLSL